jgi:hypothetical protein
MLAANSPFLSDRFRFHSLWVRSPLENTGTQHARKPSVPRKKRRRQWQQTLVRTSESLGPSQKKAAKPTWPIPLPRRFGIGVAPRNQRSRRGKCQCAVRLESVFNWSNCRNQAISLIDFGCEGNEDVPHSFPESAKTLHASALTHSSSCTMKYCLSWTRTVRTRG